MVWHWKGNGRGAGEGLMRETRLMFCMERGSGAAVSTVLPGRVVDRRCPICMSEHRAAIDQLLGTGDDDDVVEYCKLNRIEASLRDAQMHRLRHWTAIVTEPASIEEAKAVNPEIVSWDEAQARLMRMNHEMSSAGTDKISEIQAIIADLNEQIELVRDRITDPESGLMAFRVLKELQDCKMRAIKLLGQLDGEVQEASTQNVNILIAAIVPQVSQFLTSMSLDERHEMLATIDAKRRGARMDARVDYYGDDGDDEE